MLHDTPTIDLALKRFKLADDARTHQIQREIDALRFQVPELQWPDEVKQARASATVQGVPIPARPMLSIPTLDQPIQIILNTERQAHLGVQIHPISEDADDQTAEMIQGLYRSIERDSRASLARSWAFDRAVKAGTGCYRVDKEYDPYGGHPSDQRITIKRILWQGNAFFDPFAQEPDRSDGEWAFLCEDMPVATYRRKFPESTATALSDDELVAQGAPYPGWVGGDSDESRTIRVAEYWRKDHETQTVVAIEGGQGWAYEFEVPEGARLLTEDEPGYFAPVEQDHVTVVWSRINCLEELDTPQEWDGQYIPLIPVLGRELQPFDGERRFQGVIEPQKDAVRMYNYAASGAVESAALEPKAPFDIDPQEIEGYEGIWAQANVRNFPYLPRKKVLNGQVLPLMRIQADGSKMQMNLALLQQAENFIHTGTGAFQPTLGQESTQAKSGRAILSLQQQHDQSNSNWLDNLAEISMSYEAKVVLDLMPRVYDRPGRVARILDLEDNSSLVMMGQPFQPDPRTKRPVPFQGSPEQLADPSHPSRHYDLAKGRYGVSVSIGKSYKTRADQGADELGQLFQAEPQLFQILGDIYLKFRDFPGHTEAAERVKKMLPAAVRETDQQSSQQQIGDLTQQLQQQGQQLQQAAQYIQTEQAKHQAALAAAQMKAEADVQIARMNNAAKIEVARISAAKEQANIHVEAAEERLSTGLELSAQMHEAERARQHEVGMAQHGAVLADAQSDKAHQQALEQGAHDTYRQGVLNEQTHGQASESADQSHQQVLEQQQAAADAAPGGEE